MSEEPIEAEIDEEHAPVAESTAVVQMPRGEGSMALMTAADLERALEEEQKKRDLIDRYIKDNLREGIDYGVIPGCGKKPTLLKPGAERVTTLLHLRPAFEADKETRKMLNAGGDGLRAVAYICRLLNQYGEVVGEGRGVAEIKEKSSWTMNSAVKICQKRAHVDVVLRVAGLSDRFTQDIEDDPDRYRKTDVPPPRRAAPKPARQPDIDLDDDDPFGERGTGVNAPPREQRKQQPSRERPLVLPTEKQAKMIKTLLSKLNRDYERFKGELGVEHLNELEKKDASDIIEKLIEEARAAGVWQ